MTLEDPLAEFRIAEPDGWDPYKIDGLAGELMLYTWPKGGDFVAASKTKVYVAHASGLLAVPRSKIGGVGVLRHARVRFMRWGLGTYLLGMLTLIFDPIIAVILVSTGAYLVTKGFLSKALVLQLRDSRIPPIIIPHARWRAIGKVLEGMAMR